MVGRSRASSTPAASRGNRYALLDAGDSVLMAIDVQDAFLAKLPLETSSRLLNRLCWLVQVAVWKRVPLIVTAEEKDVQPLARQLEEILPDGVAVLEKGSFGLAEQANILSVVEDTRRRTAVLCGLETDVCVMHSALGLLVRGYRVAVVADATGTPEPGHTLGIERVRAAGGIITNVKGVFYEWLRTVVEVQRFHKEMPAMRDMAGFTL
jgi:nicotinamidase-related amidase